LCNLRIHKATPIRALET
jgi:hypothetical protein